MLDKLWEVSRYPNGELPSVADAGCAIEHATRLRTMIIELLG